MDKKEILATRLWYEKSQNQTKTMTDGNIRYVNFKFNLSKTDHDNLKKLLKQNKLTYPIFIHAVWGLLLNRLCTMDGIVYGSTTSQSPQLIRPIESVINETLSFASFCTKIQTQLARKTKTNTPPPKEIRYLLLSKKEGSVLKPDKQFVMDEAPLILCFQDKKIGQFSFYYHPAFFTEAIIKTLAEHFILLIQEISQNSKQKVVAINMLTDVEKQLVFHQWNKPAYNFVTPVLTGCMHGHFTRHAKQTPDALAINYQDNDISYHALENASNQLAQMLLERGVKPGDMVAVFMDRTPEIIAAMLAIFKCGAIYVPINPKFPNERVEYVLFDCQPKVILSTNPKLLPAHEQDKVLAVPDMRTLNETNVQPALSQVDPESIAYVLYTSGTTGKPKGVMIQHRCLMNLISWYQTGFKVTAADRASQFASQGFDTFLCEVVPYLASGASVHIVDDNTKLTPPLFFSWLTKQKITICDLPTSYALMIFSMSWPDHTALRLVKIGGESVTHYPKQAFPFDIWNGYGPTESTIEFCFKLILPANTLHHETTELTTPAIGKPIAHCEAYIVDKYLQPVPVGVAGELLIGGAGLSKGYLNQEALTKEKFIENGTRYRTGDLVSFLPNGDLEFKGRIDFQIKIRGYRVELGDIENAISQLPDVNEAVVIASDTANNDKTLVAYIVPDLEKIRFIYHERCMIAINHHFVEAFSEDLGKFGMAVTGLTENLETGMEVALHVKLPGSMQTSVLSARVLWSESKRAGFIFTGEKAEREMISKSVEHHQSVNNVMDLVLTASAKRHIRKALQKKLPEYMIPSVYISLLQFPLTLSGKVDVKSLPTPQNFPSIQQKTFIAPKTETEKKLVAIWEGILKKKNISMDESFFDLGGSSLSTAELSVRILHEFRTSIPAKLLFDLPYIPILGEYIDSDGKHYTSQSYIQDEIEHDMQLSEHIRPVHHLNTSMKKPEHILLTGAGGFLGLYLLRELLRTTDAKIYCLIRQGDFESAAKRLNIAIQSFHLENDISLNDRRIIAIGSDLSFHQFGLPTDQYKSLAQKIDLIYHCGAQVNIMASYSKLRGSNVLGTLEVIKFATTETNKPIHYISTLSSAYMKNEKGQLSEDFPNQRFDQLSGGYAISKWVSERLLTQVKDRGLPIAIYRSGYIAGQSNNGMTNLNDALLLLIKGCIQLGYAPDWKENIAILPVDFVSQAIINISLDQPNTSTVYHLDHPTGIMWVKLVEWLVNAGYQIKTIPMNLWKEKLVTVLPDNALYPFIPFYMAINEHEPSPVVAGDRAQAILAKANIQYPDINSETLSIFINYLRQVKFLPEPSKESSLPSLD